MAFSGLRSMAFCRAGSSSSLNSEWETCRSSEPLLSCRGTQNTLQRRSFSTNTHILQYTSNCGYGRSLGCEFQSLGLTDKSSFRASPAPLTNRCWCGLVLLMRTAFIYRSNMTLWKQNTGMVRDFKCDHMCWLICKKYRIYWIQLISDSPCVSLQWPCLCELCRSPDTPQAEPVSWGSVPDSKWCLYTDQPGQGSGKNSRDKHSKSQQNQYSDYTLDHGDGAQIFLITVGSFLERQLHTFLTFFHMLLRCFRVDFSAGAWAPPTTSASSKLWTSTC